LISKKAGMTIHVVKDISTGSPKSNTKRKR